MDFDNSFNRNTGLNIEEIEKGTTNIKLSNLVIVDISLCADLEGGGVQEFVKIYNQECFCTIDVYFKVSFRSPVIIELNMNTMPTD